jgi:hypothetical protein
MSEFRFVRFAPRLLYVLASAHGYLVSTAARGIEFSRARKHARQYSTPDVAKGVATKLRRRFGVKLNVEGFKA